MGMCCKKEDIDWVKKRMECEVEGSRSRGRPEDMERGCAKRLPSTQFEQGGCYGLW